MKVNIEVSLKPFITPNYVLTDEPPNSREDGYVECRQFRLSELHADTLSKMCDDFRKEVFKKAGKQEPPTTL